MNESSSSSWRHVRQGFLFALALSLFALFIYSLFSNPLQSGFRSAELKFTDASAQGLAIVPASCPSSPHYAGECNGQPPPSSGNGCSIFADPSSVTPVQGSALSWNAGSGQGKSFLETPSGSITPGIGAVPNPGSMNVAPSQTTTYVYSGRFLLFGLIPTGSFSCRTTVTVGNEPPPVNTQTDEGRCAASYFCQGSDLYYQTSQCSNQFIQTCQYGCSGGACLRALVPTPTALLAVSPLLVQRGVSVQISWQTQSVQSCTVSGTNGDSWSGTSGAHTSSPILGQTVYTLTCQALPGASPSTVTQSKTVNIIPIFQEI